MAAFTRKIDPVGIYIPIFGTFIPALTVLELTCTRLDRG
jgi:predicted membrane channel-forming protein YqfA (hemolysin III family)